jgi:hypothetical protein
MERGNFARSRDELPWWRHERTRDLAVGFVLGSSQPALLEWIAESLDCRRTGSLWTSMTVFRCYFMSGETIQAVRIFASSSDYEILLKAKGILHAHPEYPAVEIWDGKRLVAKLTKDALKAGR